MSALERITNTRLPFDRRHPDPSKNYGIHGLDIWFILKGPKGAVQYAVTFPVYLPSVDTSSFGSWSREIRGFDVGYHSPVPRYEGQSAMECEHLEGKQCFYDGSALRADDWTKKIFSTVGKSPDEVLWKMLEDEYIERFGE